MRAIKRDARLALLLAAVALTLAGCAQREQVAEPAPPPPAPPVKTAEPRTPHPLQQINSNLSAEEAAWHLRAGLNVAALLCDRDRKLGLAANYNRMLTRQRKPLAVAYRAEGARYSGNAALDAHSTRLYNVFSQPPSKANFCGTAARLAMEAQAIEPENFIAYAPDALARLVEPPGVRGATVATRR